MVAKTGNGLFLNGQAAAAAAAAAPPAPQAPSAGPAARVGLTAKTKFDDMERKAAAAAAPNNPNPTDIAMIKSFLTRLEPFLKENWTGQKNPLVLEQMLALPIKDIFSVSLMYIFVGISRMAAPEKCNYENLSQFLQMSANGQIGTVIGENKLTPMVEALLKASEIPTKPEGSPGAKIIAAVKVIVASCQYKQRKRISPEQVITSTIPPEPLVLGISELQHKLLNMLLPMCKRIESLQEEFANFAGLRLATALCDRKSPHDKPNTKELVLARINVWQRTNDIFKDYVLYSKHRLRELTSETHRAFSANRSSSLLASCLRFENGFAIQSEGLRRELVGNINWNALAYCKPFTNESRSIIFGLFQKFQGCMAFFFRSMLDKLEEAKKDEAARKKWMSLQHSKEDVINLLTKIEVAFSFAFDKDSRKNETPLEAMRGLPEFVQAIFKGCAYETLKICDNLTLMYEHVSETLASLKPKEFDFYPIYFLNYFLDAIIKDHIKNYDTILAASDLSRVDNDKFFLFLNIFGEIVTKYFEDKTNCENILANLGKWQNDRRIDAYEGERKAGDETAADRVTREMQQVGIVIGNFQKCVTDVDNFTDILSAVKVLTNVLTGCKQKALEAVPDELNLDWLEDFEGDENDVEEPDAKVNEADKKAQIEVEEPADIFVAKKLPPFHQVYSSQMSRLAAVFRQRLYEQFPAQAAVMTPCALTAKRVSLQQVAPYQQLEAWENIQTIMEIWSTTKDADVRDVLYYMFGIHEHLAVEQGVMSKMPFDSHRVDQQLSSFKMNPQNYHVGRNPFHTIRYRYFHSVPAAMRHRTHVPEAECKAVTEELEDRLQQMIDIHSHVYHGAFPALNDLGKQAKDGPVGSESEQKKNVELERRLVAALDEKQKQLHARVEAFGAFVKTKEGEATEGNEIEALKFLKNAQHMLGYMLKLPKLVKEASEPRFWAFQIKTCLLLTTYIAQHLGRYHSILAGDERRTHDLRQFSTYGFGKGVDQSLMNKVNVFKGAENTHQHCNMRSAAVIAEDVRFAGGMMATSKMARQVHEGRDGTKMTKREVTASQKEVIGYIVERMKFLESLLTSLLPKPQPAK